MNTLYNTSLVRIGQLNREQIEDIFGLTDRIIKNPADFENALKGKIVTALFFEPSTRTSSSFIAATQRLGGGFIPVLGVGHTSSQKGESFEHTIQTLSQYSDAIVMRHPEVGAVERASNVSSVPLINAGDGGGEHPTQAILDGYTIKTACGSIDGLTVTILGDLAHSRTMHSLALILTQFKDVTIRLVSPALLKMPGEITTELKKSKNNYSEHTDLNDVIAETDVLYVNRVQQERFTSKEEYEAVKNSYIITNESLKKAKKTMKLMNPLPIVGEIATEVDSDPRAIYFDQVRYGMFVRMALLHRILIK